MMIKIATITMDMITLISLLLPILIIKSENRAVIAIIVEVIMTVI